MVIDDSVGEVSAFPLMTRYLRRYTMGVPGEMLSVSSAIRWS
jgi:hypothetical protein